MALKSNNFRQNIPAKGKIIFIDMDGVICDFDRKRDELVASGIPEHKALASKGLFETLDPIEGAIETINMLEERFEIYFLTTAPWSNTHSWSEKRIWIGNHFDKRFKRKLIISSNKGLLNGDYIIDDRTANGVGDFKGTHLHFGTPSFPDWKSIEEFFKDK
jgi:5'(3')-deoxyribonucleotidase